MADISTTFDGRLNDDYQDDDVDDPTRYFVCSWKRRAESFGRFSLALGVTAMAAFVARARNLALGVGTIVFSLMVNASEPKIISEISIDQLTQETQRTSVSESQRDIAFVWWIPKEHWVVSLSTLDSTQRNAVLNIVEDLFILVVAQYAVSLAGMDYYPPEEVLKGLRATRLRPGREDIRLTPVRHMEGNASVVIAGLEQSIRQLLGELGNNAQLVVFEDRFARSSTRRVDPYDEGALVVELESREGPNHTLRFETPLDALFRPRICPNGKPAHVSWSYCPWSGEKLD